MGAKGFHRLFKNLGNSNHFIKVNLMGVQSNKRGIGARVTVTSTAGMSFRQNNGGGGGEWCSQGSEPLHFGIGTATEATVEVKWPSGIVDTRLFSCSQFDDQGGGRFRSLATLREFRQLRRMVCCLGSYQPQRSPIALRILAE